jgi:hypothetical protein
LYFILHHLWLIAVIAIALIAGGWWFLSSGKFQRLMDWMRPNSDKYVPARFVGEDRQLRDRKLRADVYCVTNEQKKESYHLVHSLMLRSAKTGKEFLLLTQRNSFPIDLRGKLTPALRAKYPTAQEIYIRTANDIDSRTTSDAARQMFGMTLSIVVLAGAVIVVVLGIIMFWQGRM